MATKYLATTGSNAANGDGWATAWQTIEHALANTADGDFIKGRAGNYPLSDGATFKAPADFTLLRTANPDEIYLLNYIGQGAGGGGGLWSELFN